MRKVIIYNMLFALPNTFGLLRTSAYKESIVSPGNIVAPGKSP